MVDYLMTLKLSSGNYPSSMESRSADRLVHWCHGAPGWVFMFILAYKVRSHTYDLMCFGISILFVHLMSCSRCSGF